LHTNQYIHRAPVTAFGGCGEFFIVSEAEDHATNRLVGSFVNGIFPSAAIVESIVMNGAVATAVASRAGAKLSGPVQDRLRELDWQTLAGESLPRLHGH